jgi:hypothetical protein
MNGAHQRRLHAGFFFLFALGILLYWAYWFVSGEYRRVADPVFRTFENCFPPADGLLALGLVITAVRLWRRTIAWRAGLLSAGSAMGLFTMDVYFALIYLKERLLTDPETNLIPIYVAVGLLCLTLLRYFREQAYRAAIEDANSPTTPHTNHNAAGGKQTGYTLAPTAWRGILVTILLSISFFTVAYWSWRYNEPWRPEAVVSYYFHQSFLLADMVTVFLALQCAKALWQGRLSALVWGIVLVGLMLFTTTLYAAFVVVGAETLGDSRGLVVLLVGIFYVLCAVLYVGLLRLRFTPTTA